MYNNRIKFAIDSFIKENFFTDMKNVYDLKEESKEGKSILHLIHVPRIPPPLNYLARINESEGGGMNRFMSVYNTFVGV